MILRAIFSRISKELIEQVKQNIASLLVKDNASGGKDKIFGQLMMSLEPILPSPVKWDDYIVLDEEMTFALGLTDKGALAILKALELIERYKSGRGAVFLPDKIKVMITLRSHKRSEHSAAWLARLLWEQ